MADVLSQGTSNSGKASDLALVATTSECVLHLDSIPKVGMLFNSHEEGYAFYNSYARRLGFSIRIENTSSSKKDKRVLSRLLVCSKHGQRKRHSRLLTPINPRPVTRVGCKAYLCFKLVEDGTYRVNKFIEDHNHEFFRPIEVHMLNSQRSITEPQGSMIRRMYESGIAPKKIHTFMSKQVGGSHNLCITRKDCSNFVQRERSQIMRRGDAQTVLDYFRDRQVSNADFFYMVKLDEDEKMASCFWCDAKSKMDYKIFSDVLCFDTTFKTNGYDFPYAPFVGVNHHGQSILFGCGLLFDESTDSFVWLFECFLKAMDGIAPKTIFTDQASVIAKAITLVFPDAHHRLCLWNIYQNAGKNMGHVYEKYSSFSKDFSCCVYQNETEEDFENCWATLLSKYKLQDNASMLHLYSLKDKWALVYGRGHFCAGITTTQRSESINSYFKKYFKRTLLLHEFVSKYDDVVRDRREAEILEDYHSRRATPVMKTKWFVEKEASSVYPRQIFSRFQKELLNCLNLFIERDLIVGSVHTYKISGFSNVHFRRVSYDANDVSISCSCRVFQFTGIICSHAMKVLQVHRVDKLNEKYYLKRWKKDATSFNVPPMSLERVKNLLMMSFNERYNNLAQVALAFALKAAATQKSSHVGMEDLMNCFNKLDLCVEDGSGQVQDTGSCEKSSGTSVKRIVEVQDPARKKTKSGYVRKHKSTPFKKKRVTRKSSSSKNIEVDDSIDDVQIPQTLISSSSPVQLGKVTTQYSDFIAQQGLQHSTRVVPIQETEPVPQAPIFSSYHVLPWEVTALQSDFIAQQGLQNSGVPNLTHGYFNTTNTPTTTQKSFLELLLEQGSPSPNLTNFGQTTKDSSQ